VALKHCKPLEKEPIELRRLFRAGDCEMPRFFFDVKNGHRLVDPAGVDCEGDAAARKQGIAIAKQISVDAPRSMARSVAVRDEAGREVAIIPIGTST
jgi:hypothetical protein